MINTADILTLASAAREFGYTAATLAGAAALRPAGGVHHRRLARAVHHPRGGPRISKQRRARCAAPTTEGAI